MHRMHSSSAVMPPLFLLIGDHLECTVSQLFSFSAGEWTSLDPPGGGPCVEMYDM